MTIRRMGKVLSPEAQEDRDHFEADYDARDGCRCQTPNGRPPCGWCTHPGNPRNQEEDDDCWLIGDIE